MAKPVKPTKVVKTKVVKAKANKLPKKASAPPAKPKAPAPPLLPRTLLPATGEVLDRLFAVVLSRKDADPALSHSARLLARGPAKVAQKFGEEAVECLIEAVAGNQAALIGESADVLYHLLVLWVSAGLEPNQVWEELHRREGVSGIAEKASRARKLPTKLGLGTTKIP